MRSRRVLLFLTTQAVLRAEDVLLEAGLEVDVVPKPEGVRGLCGIALEVLACELRRAVSELEMSEIPFDVYGAEQDVWSDAEQDAWRDAEEDVRGAEGDVCDAGEGNPE